MIQLASLGLSEAQRGIDAALEAAQQEGRSMAMAVVDRNGDLVMCARMDGAPERVLRFAIRKAYTAAVMGRGTLDLKREMLEKQRSLADYGDSLFTTLQGGLPVLAGGQVVGAIAVGGNTQSRDDAIAQIGLAAIRACIEEPA